jgi:hypothetical protein
VHSKLRRLTGNVKAQNGYTVKENKICLIFRPARHSAKTCICRLLGARRSLSHRYTYIRMYILPSVNIGNIHRLRMHCFLATVTDSTAMSSAGSTTESASWRTSTSAATATPCASTCFYSGNTSTEFPRRYACNATNCSLCCISRVVCSYPGGTVPVRCWAEYNGVMRT